MHDKKLTARSNEKPIARLNVIVPRELRLKAQIKALREGTTLSRKVRLWLAEYIIAPPSEDDDEV